MRTAFSIAFAPLVTLALALLAGACASESSGRERSLVADPSAGSRDELRVLGVIAHPDDEVAFAGALYKIATHLGGRCDLVVITNGESGYKYATLAERLYGVRLTREPVGRARLPEIRQREMMESAGYLGVHGVRFLGERDPRYTTDVAEVLGADSKVWDLPRIRSELDTLLEQGGYDFVIALRPRPTTHAHHQAAAALAAEAVLQQPASERPVMLVVQVVDHANASPLQFSAADGGLAVGPFVFDRTQTFGHLGRLDYRVVVNWAISAHKSQGSMQLAMNRGEREEYFLFGEQRIEGARKAAELFERLREAQFEVSGAPSSSAPPQGAALDDDSER